MLIIALYEYIPNNRIVDEVTEYKRNGETANAITDIHDETSINVENESIIKSYTVTGSDLNLYKNTERYNSGRGNPFENIIYNPYVAPAEIGTNSVSSDLPTNTTNTTNTSTGYFNSTGKTK